MAKRGRESSDSHPVLRGEERIVAPSQTEPRFGVHTHLGRAPAVELPSQPDEDAAHPGQGADSGHTWSSLADELIEAIDCANIDGSPPYEIKLQAGTTFEFDPHSGEVLDRESFSDRPRARQWLRLP